MSAAQSNSRSIGRPKRQSDKDECDPLGSLRSPLRPESSRLSAREASRLSDGRNDRLTERTFRADRNRDSSDFPHRFTRSRKTGDSRSGYDAEGYWGHLELEQKGRQPRLGAKERLGMPGSKGHASKPSDKDSDQHTSIGAEAASLDWASQVEMKDAEQVRRSAKRPSSVNSGSTEGECSSSAGEVRKSARVPKARETDPLILSRRQKQIEYGRSTPEYKEYLRQVPRRDRTRHHPSTPDKNVEYSRRGWDTIIKIWRKELHVWDPASAKQQVISNDLCEEVESPNKSASALKSASAPIDKNSPIDAVTDDSNTKDRATRTPVKNSTKAKSTSISDVASPSKRTKFGSLENMTVDDVTKSCETAIKNIGEESMSTVFDKFGLTAESGAVAIDGDDSCDVYADL